MFKSFGRDILIYGVASSVSKFIGLFLVPIYTRIFMPEEFGAIDLISTITAFVSIIGMMQLESSVSRYYYAEKNDETRSVMISTVMWTILSVSTFLFVILLLYSVQLTELLFKNAEYSSVFIIAGLTIPISNLNSLYTVIIRFKKKPIHYLMFQTSQLLITIGLTIWLIVYIRTGIIGVFIAQLSGFLLSAFLMSYYLRKQIKLIWHLNELKKMYRYSLPLVPAVAGSWANSYINRFVMLGYLSLADIGFYTVALKFASLFHLIGDAFRMAWGPFFWEVFEKYENHRKIFIDLQMLVTYLIFCLIIIITLFSDKIILIFTTSEYMQSSRLIGLLSMSLGITSVLAQITGMGPGITKRTEYNTLIYLLSVAVNIGGLFILVPLYGLIGVPISLLLGSLSIWIIGWYNSERLYTVGFRKIPSFLMTVVTLLLILVSLVFELPLSFKLFLLFVIFSGLFLRYRLSILSIVKKMSIN